MILGTNWLTLACTDSKREHKSLDTGLSSTGGGGVPPQAVPPPLKFGPKTMEKFK